MAFTSAIASCATFLFLRVLTWPYIDVICLGFSSCSIHEALNCYRSLEITQVQFSTDERTVFRHCGDHSEIRRFLSLRSKRFRVARFSAFCPREKWGQVLPNRTETLCYAGWMFLMFKFLRSKCFYYISKLVHALWLVNFAVRTLLHGPLKFKVFCC